MKYIILLCTNIFCIASAAQNKKINFELEASLNISTSGSKYKRHTNPENTFSLQYFSSKKWDQLYYNFRGIAIYPLSNEISTGLGTGIYLFTNETHFLNTKRTFAAIPAQAVFDYHTKLNGQKWWGARLSPGALFYKIDDIVYTINNALLLDIELYHQLSKRSKLRLGANLIKENAKYELYLSNTNTYFKHNFSLNRSALYLGYGFIIN